MGALLAGHLLTARPSETLIDLAIYSVLIAVYTIFHKQILYVSFDLVTARSIGGGCLLASLRLGE